MDIAMLSMSLSQMKLGQAVGISVLKMAKETAVSQNEGLLQAMQQSVQPHLGQRIDLRA
ncbi:YjfB family protein [Paenibacillus methanolicus]|uniref:Putative motility protein YjfB-like n=1 Tax=Paenibacillus methanolicus TaxID=582686 RepID=A0A5S5BSS7_9BACL|nr:YjfB family protein [Paenibacillus methanolicus]TYP69356.1 putative motility protein YjfB-like [Paenibacillus methanolicus]